MSSQSGGSSSIGGDALYEHLSTYAEIGMALSGESNVGRLLEMIVYEARKITGADAGTLYMVSDDGKSLNFVILQNDTMKTRMGGTSGVAINLPPVPLYVDDSPNFGNVSSYVAVSGNIVNIADVYESEEFDFTGPRKYDKATGYRSKSMLVIPMRNHENEIIGVLQLLNAMNAESGDGIGVFTDDRVMLVASLASQAAAALTKTQLIQDLKNLFYAFIKSIANAIEEKSPYTGGHINRVVDITMMIAEEMNQLNEGPFRDIHFSEDELEELKLAAWLHDIGKIITPEYVVDKSSKLETIFDRVELVRQRFELIASRLETQYLRRMIEAGGDGTAKEKKLRAEMTAALEKLAEERDFVLSCNEPGEFMSDERIERLQKIAAQTFDNGGDIQPYLTENEVENLCIRKGTLTGKERGIIENHARMTGKMLRELPFPKKLSRVPDIASGHHEKLDGSGYPLGLKGDEVSLEARIMAVADIFEALTAKDRPYKKPMPLSQAVKILGFMKKDMHIDPDVHDLFLSSGLFRKYAERELNPEQFDAVQVNPTLTKRTVLLAGLAGMETIAATLTSWGANIEQIDDGLQVLDVLRQTHEDGRSYKLVVLDAGLSGMDGFAVAEELAKISGFPMWSVLVVSDKHEPGAVSLAIALGLAGYVVTPVEEEELRKVVFAVDARRFERAPIKRRKTCRVQDETARPRMLVVEDSANARLLASYYLKHIPVDVEFAESGKQGVSAFGDNRYALVLVGSQLSDISAEDFVQQVRQVERELAVCETPLVALVPHYITDAGEKSLSAGFNDYLVKPVSKQGLTDAVRRYILTEEKG